jgi:hypothetical protein
MFHVFLEFQLRMRQVQISDTSVPVCCPNQVAVMERDTGLRILTDEEVDVVVKEVEAEKEAAEAAKRGGASAAGAR